MKVNERRRILCALDASRAYLEGSTPYEIAMELMVQALDIVAPSDRQGLFDAAVAELNDPVET
jgi:hypothetical protein